MPHQLAEALLTVETTSSGRRIARLRWQCALATKPRDIRLTWDGKLLDVADTSTFVLPKSESGTVHILRAELDFGSGVAAMAEALVGSRDRDYTSAELTAVPVLVAEGRRRLALDDLAGTPSARGQPLRAMAVEEGSADVVFVVDPGADALLDAIQGGQSGSFPSHLALSKGILFSFVFPAPETYTETSFELYPSIGPLGRADATLLAAYRRVRHLYPMRDGASLPGAAQLSGVLAVKNSRRRAVVWILGAKWPLSDPSLEIARGFLRALNVPLFVRRIVPKGELSRVSEGETAVSAPWQLAKAIGALESALKRQRIVWMEGRHLLQTIALSPGAKGLEIAR